MVGLLQSLVGSTWTLLLLSYGNRVNQRLIPEPRTAHPLGGHPSIDLFLGALNFNFLAVVALLCLRLVLSALLELVSNKRHRYILRSTKVVVLVPASVPNCVLLQLTVS